MKTAMKAGNEGEEGRMCKIETAEEGVLIQ